MELGYYSKAQVYWHNNVLYGIRIRIKNYLCRLRAQENNYMQELDLRIQECLGDTEILPRILEYYTTTLRSFGLSEQTSIVMAAHVIERMSEQNISLEQREREIFGIFLQTRGSRARFNGNLIEVFDDALMRRSVAFSRLVRLEVSDMPETGVLNLYSTDESLLRPLDGFDVINTRSRDGIKGDFSVVVLNNCLHHESPENVGTLLKQATERAGSRLIILENRTLGATKREQEIDRNLQFMHEYLFHRLLQDPDRHNVGLPENYNTQQGWQKEVEPYGWRMAEERPTFTFDQHHVLMVFNRE